MLRHKGQFLGLVLRLPIGFDTRLQVFPRQQNLTPQPRTLHRHTHLHRAFQPRKLPPFKRNGHAAVQQRIRTLHFYQLFQSFVHFRLNLACRIRNLIRGTAFRWFVDLQLAFHLRHFRQRQLAAQVGQNHAVGYRHRLTAHKLDFPLAR